MPESLITKKAIAEGMRAALKEKSFDKVSISDITKQCGLNRQTFYYHFQDKYELLSWIYYTDLFGQLMEDITLDNWHLKMRTMLDAMKAEHSFYMNTIRCARDCFSDYLFEITAALFEEAISSLDTGGKTEEAERRFTSRFFAYGICGIILSWVAGGMKQNTADLCMSLKRVAVNSERLAYLRYKEEGNMS